MNTLLPIKCDIEIKVDPPINKNNIDNFNFYDNKIPDLKPQFERYKKLNNIIPSFYLFDDSHKFDFLNEFDSDFVKMEFFRNRFNTSKVRIERIFLQIQENIILLDGIKNEIDLISDLNTSDYKLKQLQIQTILIDVNKLFEILDDLISRSFRFYDEYSALKNQLGDFSVDDVQKSIKYSNIKLIFHNMFCNIVYGTKNIVPNNIINPLLVKHLTRLYIDQLEIEINDNKNYPTTIGLMNFLNDMCKIFE